MGLVENGVRFVAGWEGAPVIGVGMQQIVRHAVDNSLWHLGSARIVEEHGLAGQGRELGADSIKVEAHSDLQSGAKAERSAFLRLPRPVSPQPGELML